MKLANYQPGRIEFERAPESAPNDLAQRLGPKTSALDRQPMGRHAWSTKAVAETISRNARRCRHTRSERAEAESASDVSCGLQDAFPKRAKHYRRQNPRKKLRNEAYGQRPYQKWKMNGIHSRRIDRCTLYATDALVAVRFVTVLARPDWNGIPVSGPSDSDCTRRR